MSKVDQAERVVGVIKKMANMKRSKLHIAMFPWFAFGHLTPYLHLSNKLAERGHKVSFLLPKGTQSRMEQQYCSHNREVGDLIQFFPLQVPHVDGLPLGAQTASDISTTSIIPHFFSAFDQTRDQVQTILTSLSLNKPPDFIFFDFAFWVPALARPLGIKSICYSVVSAAILAMNFVPSLKIQKTWTVSELIQTPPGYPSSKVKLQPKEAATSRNIARELGASGLTLYERFTTSMKECDAMAIRTCSEIEGHFCDFISQQYARKTLLLTGSVLPNAPLLDEKWDKWLSKFKPSTVVFCALGSEISLEKKQFQELLLGFELTRRPFLVALQAPQGCATIEEAMPDEGFLKRIEGRGLVDGGWVPQPAILKHPSIGCFVSHCGFGSMWESLVNDCQIVLVPHLKDQIVNTRVMVEELKVAVEVEREENLWIRKEKLSKAIESVMEDSEVAALLRINHAKWKDIILSQEMHGTYIETFIQNLMEMMEDI